jgi:hypothetical protein
MQVRTRVLRTRKIRTREQGRKSRQDETNIIEQGPDGCICNGDKCTKETRMFPWFEEDHYGN